MAENSKDKIIQAALLLFGQKGYDATSVQEICSLAGVSKGAFYHHFAAKQLLFMTLIQTWTAALSDHLQGVPDEEQSVPQTFIKMAERSEAAFELVPTGFPILVDFWKHSITDENVWKVNLEPYQYFKRFFMKLLEKGKREGSIKATVDVEKAGLLMVAVAMGFLLQAAIDYQAKDWGTITTEGLQMVFEGIEEK